MCQPLLQMLARQERGDRILRDLLRRMQNMKADMENAAADHVATLAGVRSAQEFQVLEEEGGAGGRHLRRGDEETPSATLRPG